MTIDTSVLRTRRALLGAALGAAAATVASALGRPVPVRAGSDGDVVLGAANESTTRTKIHTVDDVALQGSSDHQAGVYGYSASSVGVVGQSYSHFGITADSHGGIAIHAQSWGSGSPGLLSLSVGDSTGVHGYSGSPSAVPASPGKTGVFGYAAQDNAAVGVLGESLAGVGVKGTSDSGHGIRGLSTSGHGVEGLTSASSKPAILGVSQGAGSGVQGYSGPYSTRPVAPAKTGVYGYAAQDATSVGVKGESTVGHGVRGQSTSGAGISGQSTSGYGVSGVSALSVGTAGRSTSGVGVLGQSTSAMAIYGVSDATTQPAVVARSQANHTGIFGVSGGSLGSVPPAPAKTGVYGRATQDADARGVHGYSAAGQGVRGQATSGTGVYATATTGVALRAVGRVKLDKCAGVATIAAGTKSKVVAPGIDLVSTSAVVATLQGSAGGTTTVHRCVVNTTADTFTIYLTANSTANVRVAWHVFG